MTCADPDVCVRDGERGLFRVCDDDDEEPAAAGVLGVLRKNVHDCSSHRSRGLKYSRTSPNDRDGKRNDLLSVKARGCITSGSAASQTRGAQRASRAMRWTGTQAHTQMSTHVKWAGVQCRQGKGARDIRTGRETYYYVVRHILLAHIASVLPSFLPYLLTYL